MLKLYGCKGCGSAVVEAMLRMAQVPYDYVEALQWQPAFKRIPELERLNPLGQVPVLVLDDGSVMTESSAILLWLAEKTPGLAPTDPATRAQFLRWMSFVPASVYSVFAFRDFPERWVEGEEAQKAFREKLTQRLRDMWTTMESQLHPAPYVLGSSMSVLDLYLAMVSRWSPGRQWILAHCPKLGAAVTLTEQHPVVARTWKENFGT
ncbi:MAG: glutathione S-transferase family protein [Betaproteobacteria bacterium]|nr:glutathione S-transferase family protein [Betaproteobacteria bacterium]